MAILFTPDELADFLQKPVTEAAAASAERVVWGWLRPVLGLTERPELVAPELFSWAMELGAIAHENPSGLASYQLGGERAQFSAERRAEILREAAAGGLQPGGGNGQLTPRGSFPAAQCWPDPIQPRRY